MRTYLKRFALTGVVVIAGVTSAASAASVQGSASVQILEPLTINEVSSMSLGNFTVNGQSGTITLSPSGSVAVTGGVSAAGGSPQAGQFSAAGQANTNVSISFTDGTLSYNSETMLLTDFQHDAGTTPIFDSDGNLTFNVGGQIDVSGDQTIGLYSGSYAVSINYP